MRFTRSGRARHPRTPVEDGRTPPGRVIFGGDRGARRHGGELPALRPASSGPHPARFRSGAAVGAVSAGREDRLLTRSPRCGAKCRRVSARGRFDAGSGRARCRCRPRGWRGRARCGRGRRPRRNRRPAPDGCGSRRTMPAVPREQSLRRAPVLGNRGDAVGDRVGFVPGLDLQPLAFDPADLREMELVHRAPRRRHGTDGAALDAPVPLRPRHRPATRGARGGALLRGPRPVGPGVRRQRDHPSPQAQGRPPRTDRDPGARASRRDRLPMRPPRGSRPRPSPPRGSTGRALARVHARQRWVPARSRCDPPGAGSRPPCPPAARADGGAGRGRAITISR